MKLYKDETIHTTKLVDITCDVCGESCRDSIDMNYELVTLSGSWGYSSQKDRTTWRCDICEDCANKVKGFIESLGGKIIVKDYLTHYKGLDRT